MLSICRMSIGSCDYYTSLAKEDYYTQGGEPPGRWFGKSADILQLSGQVDNDHLKAVLRGVSPDGKNLVQNAGKERQPGQDFTFSAPKSVSVVWANADQKVRQKIQQAQNNAVDKALERIEELALTRRGKGGHNKEHPIGIVAAKFEHSTSRAQDPQLHTHCVVANLVCRDDGSWGGMESTLQYQNKLALGALYRCELAAGFQKLGFQVQRDGDSFEIEGVGKEIIDYFSTRREEIEKSLATKGLTGARAAEIAALDTRQAKEMQSRAVLFREWQEASRELSFDFSDVMNRAEPSKELENPKTIEEFFEDLTDKTSTFSEADIWKTVAIDGQGHLNADGVRKRVSECLESSELVSLRNEKTGTIRYSTRKRVELEKRMVESFEKRKGEDSHRVSEQAVKKALVSRSLTAGQEAAFKKITQGINSIELLQGHAGTGKSYLLGAAKEVWEESGYRVKGCALVGKAAQGLEEGSGIESQTLHSFLYELEERRSVLSKKSILVLDEAGMVGSVQMEDLLIRAEQAGSKVVLVGDSKQLQPVSGGGSFAALWDRENDQLEITDVFRLKEVWQQEAALKIREGKSLQALEMYDNNGSISIADDRKQAINLMVQDWSQRYNQDKPGDSIMLASTNWEVDSINDWARQHLQDEGKLGPVSANFHSESQGQDIKLAEKDRIVFLKNNNELGVKNGTLAQVDFVAKTESGTYVHARTDDGKSVKFSDREYGHIQYGYAVTTHKSQGVTVDRSYVLGGGPMVSQEMAYVQATRQRHEVNWYFSKDDPEVSFSKGGLSKVLEETSKKMDRSQGKDTTLDYSIEKQVETDKLSKQLSQNYEFTLSR
ncbi:MobF family relaxase [Maridesulfovibrio sp.]|uniref:MobF family relaxase n=1 Tax=Maridesulfovibrio sp. TaxID=2795000 RepID=UPI002AA64B7B|nr:MobF family relaxase [Maridesulfovibrio sp.]